MDEGAPLDPEEARLRPTYAVVSRGRLRANLAAVRARAAPAGVMAVLKAHAYGDGLEAVARCLAPRADAFGVALVEEGIALRRLGLGTTPSWSWAGSVTDKVRTFTITDGEGLDAWEAPQRAIASVRYLGWSLMTSPGQWEALDRDIFLDPKGTLVQRDTARRLIPRTIGYSAALLDYFFRGRLEVSAMQVGSDAYGIRVVNLSREPMANGTLRIYQDSGAENDPDAESLLSQIAQSEVGAVSLEV